MMIKETMQTARWFCEMHRAWVETDCPSCDDELMASTEADL